MQKFIIKSTLFCLGLLILVQVLAYIANILAPDNNAITLKSDQQAVKNLLNSSQQIEALAIGNSHAYAINFEALGYNGYRLARSGRDIFEIKYYLEGLLPRLPHVKTVFITVSYFTFQRDNALSDEVRIRRTHTYAAVPLWRFFKGDFANFVMAKIHPIFPVIDITREDSWEGVFRAIISQNSEDAKKTQPAGEHLEYRCADRGYDYIMAHADLRARGYIQSTTNMALQRPDIHLDTYNTMVDIIQQLQARNVRVIFVTPPYFYAYTKIYQENAPESISLMEQNMQTLQQDYGIKYYNFSLDEDFTLNHRAFSDSDHLNRCSAKEFSKKFKQIIAQDSP